MNSLSRTEILTVRPLKIVLVTLLAIVLCASTFAEDVAEPSNDSEYFLSPMGGFIGDQNLPPPIWGPPLNVMMLAEDNGVGNTQNQLWQTYSMIHYFADASYFEISRPVVSINGQLTDTFPNDEFETNYLIVVGPNVVKEQKLSPAVLKQLESSSIAMSAGLKTILNAEFIKDERPFKGKIYPDDLSCASAASFSLSPDDGRIVIDAYILAMDEGLSQDEQFACISNKVITSFGVQQRPYSAIIGHIGNNMNTYLSAPLVLFTAGMCRRDGFDQHDCYKKLAQGFLLEKYTLFAKEE